MSILDALLYKSFGPVFIKENSDAESFIEKMKALSSKASGKVKDKIDQQISAAESGSIHKFNRPQTRHTSHRS